MQRAGKNDSKAGKSARPQQPPTAMPKNRQATVSTIRENLPPSMLDRTMGVVIRALSLGGDVYLGRLPQETDAQFLARVEADLTKREAERETRVAASHRRDREGVTLKGKRLEQAERIVSDCAQAAIATAELANAAICADTKEAAAILTALENQSMWITRRLDTLSAILGDDPGTGCFLDQLEALTEERAAELEREEAEND